MTSLEPIGAYRLPLEGLGFIYRVENADLTKRHFREAPGSRRTHLHVRRSGSWAEQFSLLFRDYMRTHKEDAARYAELKQRLAAQYGEDRLGYTEAKGPFTWEVMRRPAYSRDKPSDMSVAVPSWARHNCIVYAPAVCP